MNGYLTISLEEAAVKTEASAIQMLDALTLLQQQIQQVGHALTRMFDATNRTRRYRA